MHQSDLDDTLRSIIHQYGLEQVIRSLRQLEMSGTQSEDSKRILRQSSDTTPSNSNSKRARVTAPDRVAKMGLPPEKEQAVIELARMFQDKSFLPTFPDIANFCQIYGIDEPASRSRDSAIPRVFNFIAEMEPADIQRILDEGMFSGPSRLGPIADAIRGHNRARTAKGGNTQD